MKIKKGFTLAEVLITLTIIGVVTALTVPSLLANVADKTYATKRKGLATRIAQAISQIGTITAYEAIAPAGSTETDYAQKYSSMNFITEALSKGYTITTICEYDQFDGCDFPKRIVGLGTVASFNSSLFSRLSDLNANNTTGVGGITFDAYAALFKTKNGESVMLYYNPKCENEQDVNPTTMEKKFANEVCINIIYDLDGARKGPNKVGKDIGYILVLHPDSSYVYMPELLGGVVNAATVRPSSGVDNANKYCSTATRINYKGGPFKLPDKYYYYAVAINGGLGGASDLFFWSSSIEGTGNNDYGWQVNPAMATAKLIERTQTANVACILPNSN